MSFHFSRSRKTARHGSITSNPCQIPLAGTFCDLGSGMSQARGSSPKRRIVRSGSPDQGRSRDAGGMRAGPCPWGARMTASQAPRRAEERESSLSLESCRSHAPSGFSRRKTRETPAGISRISSGHYLVVYRSKYGYSLYVTLACLEETRTTPPLAHRAHTIPDPFWTAVLNDNVARRDHHLRPGPAVSPLTADHRPPRACSSTYKHNAPCPTRRTRAMTRARAHSRGSTSYTPSSTDPPCRQSEAKAVDDKGKSARPCVSATPHRGSTAGCMRVVNSSSEHAIGR